ncbi:MAG: hypothetical protein ACXWR1_21295 [Bdellovibrionota bacterium]
MSAARTSAHKHGRELLRSGAYQDAIRAMEQTVLLHGSHVGLRSDLAFAAYLAGDMGTFRLSVNALEAEFGAARPRLSEKSRLLTQVSLAKFFEELGRVADAAELVDSALAQLTPGHELDFQIRAQKLRQLASFGRDDEVAPLYRDCLFASERNPNQLIECFHALILAEARLLGFASAWARLLELARRSDLFPSDLRLCAMDLLEFALETQQDDAIARILTFLPVLGGQEPDAFERELLQLAHGAPAASEEDFLRWTRLISPMGHLRLLALEAKRPGGANQAARTRLALQLDSFDHRTRAFLSRKWRSAFISDEVLELEVRTDTLTVSLGDKTLTFGARAQPWELLRVLSGEAEIPPQKVLAALDKRDEQCEHESLRIQLLRLNKKLMPLAGLDWVVRYSKHGVQRNPRVRLRFVS